jgi:hypothetical protein
MQSRPTEFKLIPYKCFYMFESVPGSCFNPENYDQATLEAFIGRKKTRMYYCDHDGLSTISELVKKNESIFLSGRSSISDPDVVCIWEVIVPIEVLNQNPSYSSLLEDSYSKKKVQIVANIMKINNFENTSKLYIEPLMTDEEAILNPKFWGVDLERKRERAFFAGKVLGEIDAKKPQLEEESKSQPNSVYTFSKNKLCDLNLFSLVFSFLHTRQPIIERKKIVDNSASTPAQNRPGGK